MNTDEMRAEFEECASRLSAHLIDLVVRVTRGLTVIELFMDAEQGVTSDLCSAVSREVTALLERRGWIQGPYRLDVSSPGIERPLRFPWQYRKHVGRVLDVSVHGPSGPEHQTGRLSAVGDEGITLETAHGGPARVIPFGDLARAVVRPPW